MAKMLKHKETGELFIYTSLLAQNSFLEMVVEDPVADVLKELKAAESAPVVETPVVETPVVETPVVETPVVEPVAAKPKQKKAVVKTVEDDALAAALE